MNEDNAIVNNGDAAQLVPVELKDHSKDPVIVEPGKVVEKKKRGRPAKKAKVVREFYCATCREKYFEDTVMKIPAGDRRWAIFCPVDQKMLTFLQPDLDKKVEKLIKNNPTGK